MDSDNEGEPRDGFIIYGEMYDVDEPDHVMPPEPEDMEADDDEEVATGDEEHFDITLAAAHSYMGSELQDVSGRNVLEAGWRGSVPGTLYHGCVFPGETVPLLLLDRDDAATLANALKRDRLFALLSPDARGAALSGLGVVCEVFEAANAAPARFKARALARCRLCTSAPHHFLQAQHNKMRQLEVEVLAEVALAGPLRAARLACLDRLRSGDSQQDRKLRTLDALVTPWPLFVYDMFDFGRMRAVIADYFRTLNLERLLPPEPVALSFWVARNLTLSPRGRLALFAVDNALLRLHMECNLISRKSVVCCGACRCVLARREHVFAMSSDGVHSTYTNPGGHMHDIVTVRKALHVELNGASSDEYSWFPGYRWTCAICARCMAHVGWRFDALRRNLRPARFYGLCRNYAAPEGEEGGDGEEGESEGEPEGGGGPRERNLRHVPVVHYRIIRYLKSVPTMHLHLRRNYEYNRTWVQNCIE